MLSILKKKWITAWPVGNRQTSPKMSSLGTQFHKKMGPKSIGTSMISPKYRDILWKCAKTFWKNSEKVLGKEIFKKVHIFHFLCWHWCNAKLKKWAFYMVREDRFWKYTWPRSWQFFAFLKPIVSISVNEKRIRAQNDFWPNTSKI